MTEAELLSLDDASFLEQAYRQALGRAPDPSGLRGYLLRLKQGADKGDLLRELADSVEGRAWAAKSGRPDLPGPTRPARAAQGRLVTSLADMMALQDEAFVDNAYRLVLGRRADGEGRQNYLLALRTGVDRLEILGQLMGSEEGRRRSVDLPELQSAVASQRVWRMPIVRQARRAWNLVSRQWASRQTSSSANTSRSPVTATVTTIPSTAGALPKPMRPVSWPPTPKSRTPDMNHGDTSAAKGLKTSRIGQTAPRAPDSTPTAWVLATEPGQPGGAKLGIDGFVGAQLQGWSTRDGSPCDLSVGFGGRSIGRIAPDGDRLDLQELYDLATPRVGFTSLLGGLLQFAALAPDCHAAQLTQTSEADDGLSHPLNLLDYAEQALTFSPMRALMRPLLGRRAGAIRAMRLLSTHEGALLFEAEQGGADERVFVDLYQSRQPAELTRIARFAVVLDGQISELTFRMLDPEHAILMVVTDSSRCIITTDCFPLPALLSETNAPLIEYHVVLETGKPAYGVAAKIARTHLDAAIKTRLNPQPEVVVGPTRSSTCLLAYGRDNADVHVPSLLRRLASMAGQVAYLDPRGEVQTLDGGKGRLADLLDTSTASHVLLVDADSHLRPDFWAVVDEHRFRFQGEGERAELVHWHGLWLDGLSRPWVAKSAPLLHEVFRRHDLLSLRSALVRKQALQARLAASDTDFRSGRFSIESAFADLSADHVLQLPIVMETVRTAITPLVQQRYQSEQVVLPRHPARAGGPQPHAGVSVVINYRDGVEDTLKCLESIAGQDANGPLEIVLVNNNSTAHSVATILGRARDLFGADKVCAIDFPHRFNHSLQCNLAAVTAKYDLLLMLSNDSFLRTPSAIARSAEVACVPWVGTCGYRIVGNEAAKGRLQSLGLSLNERRYLFSGGSPVTTGLPPAFAHDCTFEVLGNTFAAVMLRKDVYLKLDGLDGDAFPTNYNDIDFSFRATHAGLRHVVIGSEIIEHMGRGSREADQDLPIDQRIIERAPHLSVLARLGFQQL